MTRCKSLATPMENNFNKLCGYVIGPDLANPSKYHPNWSIDVPCEHLSRYMLSNEHFESIHDQAHSCTLGCCQTHSKLHGTINLSLR